MEANKLHLLPIAYWMENIHHQNSKRHTDLQPSPLYLTFNRGQFRRSTRDFIFPYILSKEKRNTYRIFCKWFDYFLTIEKYRKNVYFICASILPPLRNIQKHFHISPILDAYNRYFVNGSFPCMQIVSILYY